jgi:outer membrane protein assembly factor BamB
MLQWSRRVALLVGFVAVLRVHAQNPGDAGWSQFRGPNADGIAAGTVAPPSEFGPSKNLLWRTPLSSGHSSPVIWGDRIFLTGFDTARKMLEVIALNRTTGAVMWRRDVPVEQLEPVHEVGSPATATPVVDGERVYVYFGSFGLLAYDMDGNQKWSVPLPRVQMPYGSGTSPVRAGELLILNRHAPTDSFLMAVDRRSGKQVWQVPHEFPAGMFAPRASYSTPVIVGQEVVVHGPATIDAYDLATGNRRWWVAVASTGTTTPVVAGDKVYVATWTPFGETGQWPPLPDFPTALRRYDSDHSGTLSQTELPADLMVFTRPDTSGVPGASVSVRAVFSRFDSNQDATIDAAEWAVIVDFYETGKTEHGLVAVKTAGEGNVTASHVLWKEKSSIPEVPSPLVYQNRVYMVRNGGIVSCLDATTGKLMYRARLGAGGPYYSSPIEAGNRLITASGEGTVVVFAAGDTLDVLGRNDLGEPIYATPAVSNGVLYVRTASGMSAFAQQR